MGNGGTDNSQVSHIYRNDEKLGVGLGSQPVWTSPVTRHTTDVAWGDWDGDGDLDLAMGNWGEPNQVYANNGGTLTLAWSAPIAEHTRSVFWGDWDSNGDLNLAVGNDGVSGIAEVDRVYLQPLAMYLPIIIKTEPQTMLYVTSINTGGVTVEIRDPNNNNELLLRCSIGNNVTELCGSFKAVITYHLIAITANCGTLEGTFTDALPGAVVTRRVRCN